MTELDPLIDEALITNNINCVKEHRTAVTVTPVTETVMLTDSDNQVYTSVERAKCRLAKAPAGILPERYIRSSYESNF